jgi:hypothetical protein
MKGLFLFVVLLVVGGAVVTTGIVGGGRSSSQGVNLQFNVKDLPETGLTIVTPASRDFDGAVKAQFGTNSAAVEPLLPFSILIKNSGSRSVIAYTLKWELMRGDGQTITQTRSYTTLWKLMGVEGDDRDGNIIRPNSFTFATPANIELSQVAKGAANGDPQLQAYVDNLKQELAAYTGVTVTLDGVFFDDGAFVGPDSTGYFLKVKELRDARRDLYLEVKQSLKQGKLPSQALQRVEEVTGEPDVRLTPTSTPDDYYKKYKKEAASELLSIRRASGDDKAVEHAVKLLKNKWLDLRKP